MKYSFILLINTLQRITSNCNYETFDESQLNTSQFYEKYPGIRGDFYAFGVWTMYAPLRQNFYYNDKRAPFNPNKTDSLDGGYHILNYQSDGVIQTLYKMSRVNYTDFSMPVTMTIVQLTTFWVEEYTFYFQPPFFEGYWVFMYFCFQYSTSQYNFVSYNPLDGFYQPLYVTNLQIETASTNVQLEYGGGGKYQIGNFMFNLDLFPGRVSKIQIMDNPQFFDYDQDSLFVQYISSCFMPSTCSGSKEIKVLDGIFTFRNLTQKEFLIDIPLQHYTIEFWIKRNSLFKAQSIEQIFFFGSHLNLQGLVRQAMLICKPYAGNMVFNLLFDAYYFYPADILAVDQTFYQLQHRFEISLQQLSEWNFMRFYFYKQIYKQFLTVQVYSAQNNYYYSAEQMNIFWLYQFSNYQTALTLFSYLYNEDLLVMTQFQGVIANLKITYCLFQSPDFADTSNLDCHPQCQKCYGPTQWDCTSCYVNQHRVLLAIKNSCYCKVGYQEVENQLICQKIILEVPKHAIQIYGIPQFCKRGYFEYWKDEILLDCLPCPQSRQYDCLNCLLDSQNWYQNPICNFELTSNDGIFYSISQRNTIDYFTVVYEEKSISQCNGCQSKNLCNQNRFKVNGQCQICSQNCGICNESVCLKCERSYYLIGNQCQKCETHCIECSVISNLIQCTQCPDYYALYNGFCYKCGVYCQKCQVKFTRKNVQYLKCIQCFYDTFPSLDGENCYHNNNKQCISPFQYSKLDHQISTIIYDFEPQQSIYISDGCLYCTIDNFLDIKDHRLQCQLQGTTQYRFGCSFPFVFENYLGCLIGTVNGIPQGIFPNKFNYFGTGLCFNEFPNCLYCLRLDLEYDQVCLICEPGFYNDYYTNDCRPCPLECQICKEVDNSMVEKIRDFILFSYLYDFDLQQFLKLTQDPDESNIQLICLSCSDGHTLYKGQCIPNCPNNCLECQIIENKHVCISCLQLNEYSFYTIQDGLCIQCPTNCKLCQLRTKEQKQIFNPFFNNQLYDQFSNLCVQSFDDKLFYDQQLKQFINCDNCYKQVDFEINVFCNSYSFTDTFNIKLEQLFNSNESNRLFNIETNDYYLYLNQEYVKQINYKFILQQNSICKLNVNTYFTSSLQQNIFNLLHLNFILEGNNSTLIMNGQITLSNFTSIEIRNLNIKDGGIITNNIKDYAIKMEKLSFSFLKINNLSTFNFNNASSISIKHIQISNFTQKTSSSILVINNIRSKHLISIINWTVTDSEFQTNPIFNFNVQWLNLIFQDFFIQNITIISSLLFNFPINSTFEINNFKIVDSSIINTTGLLQFIRPILIKDFFLQNSKIENSIIIQTKASLGLQRAQFSELQIFGNTTLLKASTFSSNSEICLLQVSYFYIFYEEKQALLSVVNDENFHVKTVLKELLMQQISLKLIQIDQKIQQSIEQSIFYLDCSVVELDNITVKRGLGFPEFSILTASQVTINNTLITLDQLYYFKSLHINFECIQQRNNALYNSFMILNNVEITKFNFLHIHQIILFDSVLIEFKQTINQNFSIVEINKCIFSSNILHLITSQSITSLLRIQSSQGLSVYFSDNIYQQNLLVIQKDIYVSTQGLLFNIDANYSSIFGCIFQQNMIINGQSSISLIQSTEIIIENSKFLDNSIFQYSTLKQFLIWGYETKVDKENLEKLISVKSYGGNGNLKANQIQILNTYINNSYSQQGACFDITLLENGSFRVLNSSFGNLKAETQGGCFFIQSRSVNMQINIEKSIFFNIKSRESGSVLSLKTSTILTQIIFRRSNYSNIYALQGPLLYISQSNQGSPYFLMEQCHIVNQNEQFYDFVNEIELITSTELKTVTQFFSLVYFLRGIVKIQNLTITSFPSIQLFYFQNNVFLKDVTILNTQFSGPLLIFNRDVNPMTIEINNFNIINCSQAENLEIAELNNLRSSQIKIPSCIEYEIPETIESLVQAKSNLNQKKLIEIFKQQEIQGIIQFLNFQKDDIISIKSIKIQVKCQQCVFGALSFLNLQSPKIILINIIISQSQCGNNGCIYFGSTMNTRLLKQTDAHAKTSILIENLFCSGNQAKLGGCLFIKNQQITIRNSKIINNTANLGGAIFIEGNQSFLDAYDLFIINNTASLGSGLYSTDSFLYTENGMSFSGNSGTTLVKKPQLIQIEIYKDQILIPTITHEDQAQIVSKILTNSGSEAILHLPTGIEISKYKIFNMTSNSYQQDQQKLRLSALTDTLETQKLSGTYCNCWVVDQNGIKQENFTNKNTFYFNQSSYILDDLILYLPQDQNQQFWLQIWCNSIFIPLIEEGQIKSFHQNYYLLVKIRPYDCQLGEFHLSDLDYCHQCQIQLQQYTVSQNSKYCTIKDDQMLSEITAAQVKLKKGCWRYQQTSNTFNLCLNRQENCIGGWRWGNDLCLQGYLGALCEQCDYYNTQGNGFYELSEQFTCILCSESSITQTIVLLFSTIFMFLILYKIFNQLTEKKVPQNIIEKLGKYKIQNKKIILIEDAIYGQYIQIIIQYFQIISLGNELNQVYTFWQKQIIEILGNPFQLMNVLNICQILGVNVEVIYLQFLQNLICVVIFAIIFSAWKFLILHLRQEKISFFSNINFIFLFYFYFSISFIRSLLKLLSIRQIQGEYWIYQNIAYLFKFKNHYSVAFGGFLPLFIIFGVIIPIFFVITLKNAKKKKFIDDFGIWFIAHKNYKLEAIKIFGLVANTVLIISIDGLVAIRASFSFFLLLIYYSYTKFNLTYINLQQNNFEQSLTVVSMYIIALCAFHKVVEIQLFQNLIFIVINILLIMSWISIIQILVNTKLRALQKIKKTTARFIMQILPQFAQWNIFQRYSEQAEIRLKKRMKKLQDYILSEGKSQVKVKSAQKINNQSPQLQT